MKKGIVPNKTIRIRMRI